MSPTPDCIFILVCCLCWVGHTRHTICGAMGRPYVSYRPDFDTAIIHYDTAAPAQLATAVVPPEDCTAVDQATCVASGAADPPEDCTAPRTPPCSESRMPLPHTPPPVDANRAYDADDESESSHGMSYNVGIDSE